MKFNLLIELTLCFNPHFLIKRLQKSFLYWVDPVVMAIFKTTKIKSTIIIERGFCEAN